MEWHFCVQNWSRDKIYYCGHTPAYMSSSIGEEYLRNVESTPFQSMGERRIAFLSILDFGTVVLHEVREKYFENISISKYQDPSKIIEYWDSITNAIERVIDVEVPSEYNKFCGILGDRRNGIVHDVTEGIPEEVLDELVAIAPDWREWLITQGEKYYETVEELGAEELLVSQLKQDLQSISTANLQLLPDNQEKLDNVQSEAQEVQQKLDDMDPDTVTVSPNLADLILKISSLEREFESIESDVVGGREFEMWEPIDEKIRRYSGQTVKVEFEDGGSMELELGLVSQDHTKPLSTEVSPRGDSHLPHRLTNSEPHTPVVLEMINPRDGGSEFIGEIQSVTVL